MRSKHGIMGFVIVDACQCVFPLWDDWRVYRKALCKTNIPVNSDRLHPSWLTGSIIPNIDVILEGLAENQQIVVHCVTFEHRTAI